MSAKTFVISGLSSILVVLFIWWSLTKGYGWVTDVKQIKGIQEEEPVVVKDNFDFEAPDFDEVEESFIPSPSIVPHYLFSHSEITRVV